MHKIGTPESIGRENRRMILDQLRVKGSMSRADLTRETRMSFPAVSSNIKQLLEQGYIQEVGAGDNSLGRKAMLLSFNARRGFVMGIDIGRREIRCMLADLLGNGIANKIRTNKPEESGDWIVKNIVETARRLVRDSGVDEKDILAVCVGIPGIIRGDQMFAAPYVADFSLKELRASLERHFAAGILPENGINLGAIGESRCGIGAHCTDFVYIGYGVGLGSALILNGSLYKGIAGAAGEIGFMAVDPKHLRSRFNEIGLLESLISRERIAGSLPGKDFVAEMTDLLRAPDALRANRTIEDAVRYFGMAMINIAAVVNPQTIVISGGLGKALGGSFRAHWEAMLESHLPCPPEIVFSELNGTEPLLGAVHTALEYVYAMPITA